MQFMKAYEGIPEQLEQHLLSFITLLRQRSSIRKAPGCTSVFKMK